MTHDADGVEVGPWALGKLLREARGSRQDPAYITQAEAAMRAGVSQTWLRYIESGSPNVTAAGRRHIPSADTVCKIAVAVGIDPARALAVGGYDPAQVQAVRMTEADKYRRRIVVTLGDSRLSPEDLSVINTIVDAYVNRNAPSTAGQS